jgi:hypothetical protein
MLVSSVSGMLQVVHMDVVKVDLDVAFVASVSVACYKSFLTYVANTLI